MSVAPCVFDRDGEKEARNEAGVGVRSEQGSREAFVEDEDVHRTLGAEPIWLALLMSVRPPCSP